MIEAIQKLLFRFDLTCWYYINVKGHNDFLDVIMSFARNQWTWAPLYLLLLVFMLTNFRLKGLIWCLFFLITFGISDQLSASLFKELFQRVRPCNNPYLAHLVHSIVPCGGGYSFPSSHAANHFSLAIFSAITLKPYVKNIWTVALCWACLVCYAQVYVGVHFPLDVICGGMLGAAVGITTARLFRLRFSLAAGTESTG